MSTTIANKYRYPLNKLEQTPIKTMETRHKHAITALNHHCNDEERVSRKLNIPIEEVRAFIGTEEYKAMERRIKPQGGGWQYPEEMHDDFNEVLKQAKP